MSASARAKVLAGNWKMNGTQAEARAFFETLRKAGFTASVSARLFVPSTALEATLKLAAPLGVKIGAQNAHWETKGAFTGEISGPMLSEIGIEHTLVGHSERRQYFGETAKKRAESLLKQGFHAMACIGETRAEREAGKTFEVLERQSKALLSISESAPKSGEADALSAAIADGRFTLAYEPVWAIGTGLTATPEQAQEAHAFLRKLFPKVSILYGGSVAPENLGDLLKGPDIDGALVGGASLKPESFQKLVQILSHR